MAIVVPASSLISSLSARLSVGSDGRLLTALFSWLSMLPIVGRRGAMQGDAKSAKVWY